MPPQPLFETQIDDLPVSVYPSNAALGAAAAAEAAAVIRAAIAQRSTANIILATGNSQLTFLEALRSDTSVPWDHVTVFHMDEYIGLPPGHPASFPTFLRRHFLDFLSIRAFHPVPSEGDPDAIAREYAALLRDHPADLCALGFGENGHLAFNDPPFADFNDPLTVKVVRLDDVSRRQQVGEGHYTSLNEVPTHAITLTVPALLSAARILAIVPERRKAEAVRRALREPITDQCPGSILRRTPHAHLYLDPDSASLAFPRSIP